MKKSGEVILRVKDLRISFGREPVLTNVSFEVKRGSFVVVLGPNGAGKSTLLKALLGLIPYEGQVMWREGLKISYLPQWFNRASFDLLPLTLREFFALKSKKKDEIERALSTVGLEGKMDALPGELSAGQFQRALFVWALLQNPDVLLLDEPTTGLDRAGEDSAFYLLKEAHRKGTTVLMVSHELNVVPNICTHVLCLCRRCLAFGPAKRVLSKAVLEELYGGPVRVHFHKHPEG